MATFNNGVAGDRRAADRIQGRGVPWLGVLIGLGLAGQALLVAVGWLLPLVSEFGVAVDFISELVLGSFGAVQTAAFVVAGLTALALAVGLWRAGGASGTLRMGAILVGIYGVGMLVTAAFPTDRIDDWADLLSLSAIGMVHLAAAATSLLASFGGLLALTSALRRHRSLLRGVLGLGLFMALALAVVFIVEPGPWVGLVQRMLGTFVAAWLLLVVLALRAGHPGPMSSSDATGQ